MKWLLIITLVFVIMLIARAISEQFKEKYDFYLNLKSFLNQFKLNLSFKQDKILTFIEKINAKKQFKLFINAYKDYLKTNELDLVKIKILDSGEKEQIQEMIISMGRMDVINEISQIETYILIIDEKLKRAEEEKNKLCPLIIKLSLLFAIGLSILLI